MDEARRTKSSRFLSYVLRHRPDAIGLVLDESGWVTIDRLLEALARHGRRLTRLELHEVVANDSKRRFAITDDGTRVRAQQGHSLELDLGYLTARPPDTLYHGTVRAALPSIHEHGLRRMRRHHVHLCADEATAKRVGARRGEAVILVVDARAMHSDGHEFFVTPNDVWLTNAVPSRYLREQPTIAT